MTDVHTTGQPTLEAAARARISELADNDEKAATRPTSAELVTGVYEAFARGDLTAALAAMAADVEWHEADGGPYGGIHRGPHEVAANVLGPVARDIPDFAATPAEVIASGSTVAVVARYTGTGASTGRKLDLPVVHVWDVVDGMIVRFRQFVDAAAFRAVVSAGDG